MKEEKKDYGSLKVMSARYGSSMAFDGCGPHSEPLYELVAEDEEGKKTYFTLWDEEWPNFMESEEPLMDRLIELFEGDDDFSEEVSDILSKYSMVLKHPESECDPPEMEEYVEAKDDPRNVVYRFFAFYVDSSVTEAEKLAYFSVGKCLSEIPLQSEEETRKWLFAQYDPKYIALYNKRVKKGYKRLIADLERDLRNGSLKPTDKVSVWRDDPCLEGGYRPVSYLSPYVESPAQDDRFEPMEAQDVLQELKGWNGLGLQDKRA